MEVQVVLKVIYPVYTSQGSLLRTSYYIANSVSGQDEMIGYLRGQEGAI